MARLVRAVATQTALRPYQTIRARAETTQGFRLRHRERLREELERRKQVRKAREEPGGGGFVLLAAIGLAYASFREGGWLRAAKDKKDPKAEGATATKWKPGHPTGWQSKQEKKAFEGLLWLLGCAAVASGVIWKTRQ